MKSTQKFENATKERELSNLDKDIVPKYEDTIGFWMSKESFTQYPELLQTLEEQAKADFRTVENQIMFILNKYVKPVRRKADAGTTKK